MEAALEKITFRHRNFILIISVIFILILFQSVFSQDEKLSQNAKITIITCTPAPQLYAVFGHCAIRIYDRENRIDIVYNYGTFDFDDPHFYSNFARGKLKYFLSTQAYDYFVYQYRMNKQSITEQELRLNHHQKEEIYHFLMNNLLPENKYYSYDFFFDNCATRIRDVIQTTYKKNLIWQPESRPNNGPSFRELIAPYLKHIPWIHLGINLLLGKNADQKTTIYEQTFLPDYLFQAVKLSTFSNNGTTSPIGNTPRSVFKTRDFRKHPPFFIHPFTIFTILFLIIGYLSWIENKRNFHLFWVDRILFGLVGFLGIFMMIMWAFSEHQVVSWNFNLLWALPTHFLLIFFVSSNKFKFIIRKYALVTGIWTSLGVLTWFILPQTLPWPILPLVLILAIRSLAIYFHK